MSRLHTVVILCVTIFLRNIGTRAQEITKNQQTEIIENVLALLGTHYAFPDRVKGVEHDIRASLSAGKYTTHLRMDAFLERLNEDVQHAAKDKHIRVGSNPRIVDKIRKEAAGAVEASQEYVDMIRSENFRLRKVETLDGNIGYFKFDNFIELRYVKDAFTGGLNFLHHTSAVILDLTDNGGGASETADYLLSYLLPESTIIGTSWTRKSNLTTVSRITLDRAVRQMLSIPVYILVSNKTASAAEGVAYTLQQFKRAVVIGGQTKGLGNPGELFAIDDRLFVMIPTIVNKNTVTGSNWDGAGVTPDIPTEPGNALNRAMLEALKHLASKSSIAGKAFQYAFLADEYESLLSPQSPPAGFLDLCVGDYQGDRKITFKDGFLYFNMGPTSRRLTYMKDQTFRVDGRKDYRIKFLMSDNTVMQCAVLWYDDTKDTYDKIKYELPKNQIHR